MKTFASVLASIMAVPLTVAGGVATVRADAVSIKPKTESWADMETTPLNAKIRRARAAGEAWTSAPYLYVFNLFETADIKEMAYQFRADRIEQPRRIDIRLVRDGFADDAVRGDIHDLTLQRTNGEEWTIASAKQAWRCWRSGANTYSSKPCH